jgi:hypothetical protein
VIAPCSRQRSDHRQIWYTSANKNGFRTHQNKGPALQLKAPGFGVIKKSGFRFGLQDLATAIETSSADVVTQMDLAGCRLNCNTRNDKHYYGGIPAGDFFIFCWTAMMAPPSVATPAASGLVKYTTTSATRSLKL